MNQHSLKWIFILLAFLGGIVVGSVFYYYALGYLSNTHAIAVIYPTKGNSAQGTITFTQQKDGLHISAYITGLPPGKHGFHIHEFGNCSCDDAQCAGAHFNPTHQIHGGPANPKRHMGDMGNLVANKEGVARYQLVDGLMTLNGPYSIIGRSIIIHAQPDDMISQPTGHSGARIGCGTIGIAHNKNRVNHQ